MHNLILCFASLIQLALPYSISLYIRKVFSSPQSMLILLLLPSRLWLAPPSLLSHLNLAPVIGITDGSAAREGCYLWLYCQGPRSHTLKRLSAGGWRWRFTHLDFRGDCFSFLICLICFCWKLKNVGMWEWVLTCHWGLGIFVSLVMYY